MEEPARKRLLPKSIFVNVLLKELPKCPEFDKIKTEKYQLQLIKQLDLDYGEKCPAILSLLKGKSPAGVLEYFITAWKSKHKNHATLFKLLQALRSIGLEDEIEAIMQLKTFSCEDCTINSCFDNTLTDIHVVPDLNDQNKLRSKTREERVQLCKLFWGFNTAAIVFVVLAFLVGAFIGSHSQRNDLFFKETEPFFDPLHPITFKLSVSSYDEYQAKVRRIAENMPVELAIHIGDDKRWPGDVRLLGAQKIKKLLITGILKPDIVISILTQARNLEELHLIGTKTSIWCKGARSLNTIDYIPEIVLPKLNLIRFDSIYDCGKLFDAIVRNALTTQLRVVYFEDVTITNESQADICKFLDINKNTIRKLAFKDTNFYYLFASPDMPTISGLKDFEIISLQALETKKLFVKITTLFPDLQSFAVHKGYIQWEDLLKLLELRKIENINTGVVVPVNVDRVKLSELRNCHSKLKSLELALNFPDMSPNDICFVEGKQELRKKIGNLILETNCRARYVE